MNGLTPHPVEVAVAVGGGMVAAGGAVGVAVVLGEVLVGAERRGVAPAEVARLCGGSVADHLLRTTRLRGRASRVTRNT